MSLALLIYLGAQLDVDAFVRSIKTVPGLALAVMVVALLVNLAGSVLRLGILLRDFGFAIGWAKIGRTAILSTIGGLAFMHVVGQTLTRFAMLRRAGVPNSTTLVVSVYEKIVSTLLLLVLGLAGLVVLFGSIHFEMNAGGVLFLKMLASLALVTLLTAWLGFAPLLRRAIASIPRQIAISNVTHVAGITLVMHGAMLAAYVAIGHSVAPQVGVPALAAASLVVMFSAALPISFGGWGVRELSAVYAFDALGIGTADALVISVIIGLSSQVLLLVAGGVSAASAARRGAASAPAAAPKNGRAQHVDMFSPLAWLVPLATAGAVFFQIKVPGFGVNINLADPIVVAGAVLAVTLWWRVNRGAARWRVPHLEWMLWAASAVIVVSFLIGWMEIGLTRWALINRLAGWGLLLAYGLTGALVVAHAGRKGFTTLLRTFTAAAVAIVLVAWGFQLLRAVGVDLDFRIAAPLRMVGMAGNSNGFSFQMLMAVAVILALGDKRSPGWPSLLAGVLGGVIVGGMVLSSSRAGLLALVVILAVAIYQKSVGFKSAILAVLVGAVLVAGVVLKPGVGVVKADEPSMRGMVLLGERSVFEAVNDNTRIESVRGALDLWRESPIFGAGLGAVIETNTRQTGVPLVVHNSPVWLLAETGAVGLLVFIYLFYSVWRYAWRSASTGRRRQEALTLVLVLAGLAVAFLFHDLFYQRTFWFIVGACLALPVRSMRPAPGGGRDHADNRYRQTGL
ncbi:MAG: O-antigen ligase family protein [Alphaproteobacteria bacterium]